MSVAAARPNRQNPLLNSEFDRTTDACPRLRSSNRRRNTTSYWAGQLLSTGDPAERVALLQALLGRLEIEVAGAWTAGDRDRALRLEGRFEVFALWRESELGELAPELRR
jgi:hypothetical protein